MPRQPYSVAVPSTEKVRLHPLPFKGQGLESGFRTLPLGFLSPTRGTERLVKTIEERLGEKGGAFLKGKEGRVVFRKTSLMKKKDGMILERRFLKEFL